MLDANKLRGKIAENGMTQAQLAKAIGMSEVTFCRKLASGKFGLQDAEKMISILKITDPAAVFFGKVVT